MEGLPGVEEKLDTARYHLIMGHRNLEEKLRGLQAQGLLPLPPQDARAGGLHGSHEAPEQSHGSSDPVIGLREARATSGL